MKYSIEIISNNVISSILLDQIITLKMQHWRYSREEHLKWMKSNLMENDFHLLLFDGAKNLIAYLNLVNISVSIGSNSIEYLGLGNVCVDEKINSRGFGLLLMNSATFFLKQFNRQGILLCKSELNEFYQKAGWKIFNGNCLINNFEYSQTVFLTNELDSSEIFINKNF